ncbi:hypothetical protein [Luteipulveratus mongoliensis]|uniref:hypothetical protein n=1 Tax=Luteipulveratus mongoliensis TaxID=571913 RepID=UPI0006960DB8|nr:hypothetical protein [Luteipulveratus mongoliensis]
MSQLTAPVTTERAARLPLARPSKPTRLRVISGDDVRRSNTGFGVLCALLMTVGLLAVLLLNTARAEQSFALGSLQQTSDRLSDNEEQLRTDLAGVQAPQQLALKAQELGMVPATEVAYVRTSDGKVLGVAKKAAGASAFTVGTLPNTPASTVAGKAVAAAELGIVVVKPTPPVKPSPSATATQPPTTKSVTPPATSGHQTTPTASATQNAKPGTSRVKQKHPVPARTPGAQPTSTR